MAEIGYDPEADVVNPTGSVFCAHGAGFQVSWDQVPEYAHVESGWKPEKEGIKGADGISDAGLQAVNRQQGAIRQTGGGVERIISQEEIEEIFPPDLWEKGGGSPQIPQIPYFFRKPWQLYGQLGGKCR